MKIALKRNYTEKVPGTFSTKEEGGKGKWWREIERKRGIINIPTDVGLLVVIFDFKETSEEGFVDGCMFLFICIQK